MSQDLPDRTAWGVEFRNLTLDENGVGVVRFGGVTTGDSSGFEVAIELSESDIQLFESGELIVMVRVADADGKVFLDQQVWRGTAGPRGGHQAEPGLWRLKLYKLGAPLQERDRLEMTVTKVRGPVEGMRSFGLGVCGCEVFTPM